MSDNVLTGFTFLLVFLLILSVIFLLIREFVCWYFKFNEMLFVQKEILLQLKKQNNDSLEVDNSANIAELSTSEKSNIEHEKSYIELVTEEE